MNSAAKCSCPLIATQRIQTIAVKAVWPKGYKKFMFYSDEHEILNVHKYKNIKKFSFSGLDKLRMFFFLAHKCLNANNYWHFNIYEQEKFQTRLI